jgi:glutamate synthase domain-containing protein 3
VDLEKLDVPEDIETLRYWIARHAEETGSPQANRILENWDAAGAQFVKVFPKEYKRVLGAAKSQAVARG